MKALLLDTCILIDYLRQTATAIEFIDNLENEPSISVVTLMELYAGVKGAKEEAQLDSFLRNVAQWPINGSIAILAGRYMKQYRSSHGIDVVDAIIAATAQEHDLEIVTLNLKHFPMFTDLKRPY